MNTKSRFARRPLLAALSMATLLGCAPTSGWAQGVLDSWSSVPVPPPPAIEPVSLDIAHTALLILDMYPTSCNAVQRPSCVPSIARIQRLLTEARARKMTVIYGAGPAAANGPTTPVDALAPAVGERLVRAGADKFIGSDLEKILRDGGIQTIIVTGTSAEGSVLYTASHAAQLNLRAIVPVDGISSAKPFSELYTVWHLKNAPATVSRNVTLTTIAQITLR